MQEIFNGELPCHWICVNSYWNNYYIVYNDLTFGECPLYLYAQLTRIHLGKNSFKQNKVCRHLTLDYPINSRLYIFEIWVCVSNPVVFSDLPSSKSERRIPYNKHHDSHLSNFGLTLKTVFEIPPTKDDFFQLSPKKGTVCPREFEDTICHGHFATVIGDANLW